MEGTPFGRYRLLEMLGEGGMGQVFRAFDTSTNRVVALKVLPSHLAKDRQFRQRFQREANVAAGLTDPHIVPIHGFGEIDGRLYVDMRLVEGRDLQSLLREGPVEPAPSVAIIEQVAAALDAAHRAGLVHRDVKPSNILVTDHDFVYLIDFGIAFAAEHTALTGSGNVIGTWPYMAPERFGSGQVDARSDIYALACVLHECLTGSRPFPGDSIEQQVAGHLHSPPPRPSAITSTVPEAFDDVIATGMAKQPDQRYRTASDLARAAGSALGGGGAQVAPDPTAEPDAAPAVVSPPLPLSSPAAPWLETEAGFYPPPVPVRGKGGIGTAVASAIIAVIVVAAAITVVVFVNQSDSAQGRAPSAARASTSQAQQAVDPEALIKSSANALRQLSAVHVKIAVTGDVPGLAVRALDGDLSNKPSPASQGSMTILFGGSQMEANYVVIDGTLYGALSGNAWSNLGQASDIWDPTGLLNADVGLANLLTNFANPQVRGDEMVDGVNTVRVDGTVTADAVNKIFPELAANAPVPSTAWIRPDTDALVQLTLQPHAGQSIQFNLSAWGKAVTITRPPGV